MKTKSVVYVVVALSLITVAGAALFLAGRQLGRGETAGMLSATAGAGHAATGSMATVDPSSWGIPEGESATRRHMSDGIRAGQVDPVTGRSVLYYHDPMVPGKKFEAPGKSPFMDMMLVPAYAGSGGADASTVSVSPRIQQNLGLRTGTVTEGVLRPTVSAVGTIAWNERDQMVVQARASGYVEKLHVRAVHDRVRKGQPLFELYVPEWVAVQEDFLALRRMSGPDLSSLTAAARQRMRQAGMSEAQIASVERSGRLQSRITIFAPMAGTLIELTAREGSTVMPGSMLARINSLRTVWAHAQVPESQAGLVQVDTPVVARSPAIPGESFDGRIQALLPQIDPMTRTMTARMQLDNPNDRLVPGMFVQMVLDAGHPDKVLLVPSEALIPTGRRTLVMRIDEEGAFEPVEVITGMESANNTEIRSGLSAGDKVVLSGQFLIESEASLKGVQARMTAPAQDEMPAPAQTHSTSARVEAVNGDLLTLTHPEIPALKWPAMTMDFRLAPDLGPAPLTSGQQIDIEFQMQDGDMPRIVGLRPANGPGVSP